MTSLLNASLLCVTSLLLLITLTEARPDCRKFVFAPSCRGVAAKRTADNSDDSRPINLFPSESASAEQGDETDVMLLIPGRSTWSDRSMPQLRAALLADRLRSTDN